MAKNNSKNKTLCPKLMISAKTRESRETQRQRVRYRCNWLKMYHADESAIGTNNSIVIKSCVVELTSHQTSLLSLTLRSKINFWDIASCFRVACFNKLPVTNYQRWYILPCSAHHIRQILITPDLKSRMQDSPCQAGWRCFHTSWK